MLASVWMHIRYKRAALAGDAARRIASCSVRATAAALVCVCGCAAPGPPLPPTLNLPQVVSGTGLTAMRVGGAVRLRWTTPTKTTDKLTVKGAMTAEICREVVAGGGARSGPGAGCAAVVRVEVKAGEDSQAEDTLPAPLAEGPVRLLAYRVRLLNAAGRTAGLSPAAYAAAGAGPGEVAGFVGEVTSAGVELRWQREAAGGAGGVELERTLLDPAPVAKGERQGGLPGAEREAVEIRLRAGVVQGSGVDAGEASGPDVGRTDAGGTVDRTVEIGHSYRYTAQRVIAMTVEGKAVEVRGVPSGPLTFAVRDVFPPRVPAGLVAVPAFGEGGRAAIDLSWDVVVEQEEKPRLAGYAVYRRDADVAGGGGAWRRLGSGLVSAAAYRDADVVAGQRYAYRVTATSTAGNESAPSGEAVETAPQAP
jgi:hypothetical protein